MVVLVDAFWNAPSCFWSLLSAVRPKKSLGPGFDKPLGTDAVKHIEIRMPGAAPHSEPTRITWNLAGQHTVSWQEPITVLVNDIATTLAPASLNIYTFPRVTWLKPRVKGKPNLFAVANAALVASRRSAEALEGLELAVLKLVFLTIASHPREREVLRLPDASGEPIAGAVHTRARMRMATQARTHARGRHARGRSRTHEHARTNMHASSSLALAELLAALLAELLAEVAVARRRVPGTPRSSSSDGP